MKTLKSLGRVRLRGVLIGAGYDTGAHEIWIDTRQFGELIIKNHKGAGRVA